MLRLSVFLGCLGAFGCTAKRPGAGEPFLVSDSRIAGPEYQQILDELHNLEKDYPGRATVVPYGESVTGRPLAMLRIGGFAKTAAAAAAPGRRPAILITGAIHGGEFLHVEDRLPRFFLERDASGKGGGVAEFLARGGVIFIAPITNPDGYAAHKRGNGHGKDLNRDFALERARKAGFTQPETRGLVAALERELQERDLALAMTLDYHCCGTALIYPWGHSEKERMPPVDERAHRKMAQLMLAGFHGYGMGQAIDVIGYTALGASDDFYHERFGAKSFTFEGAEGVENRQFELHAALWERVLGELSAH